DEEILGPIFAYGVPLLDARDSAQNLECPLGTPKRGPQLRRSRELAIDGQASSLSDKRAQGLEQFAVLLEQDVAPTQVRYSAAAPIPRRHEGFPVLVFP